VAGGIVFGGGTISVARNADEIEGGVEGNLAREIAKKDCGALQNTDQNDRLSLEVAGDLRSQFGNPFCDRLAGQHHFKF
jgi:hypothetical protein